MTEQLNETNTAEVKEVKTYTQEEVDKLVTSEADRRVTEALKTQARKNEAKIREAEKLAVMNEQEKFQYELEKREQAIREKELQLTKAENRAEGLSILSEKKLDGALIDIVLDTDAEVMHERIKLLEETFNNAVKAEIERRLGSSSPIKSQVDGLSMTREQFSKLSLAQKTELFNRDPEEFNRLSK